MADETERKEILFRLTNIFRDVFDDETLNITEETSAADIAEWDSLMHITLCVASEREFNVRLNSTEIARLDNVGGLIDLLTKT